MLEGGIAPSACQRCVPIVHLIEDGYMVSITETTHEPDCRNHPKNNPGHAAGAIG
jgi:hypothetical protein